MIDIVILITCGGAGFLIGKFFEKSVCRKIALYGDLRKFAVGMKNNVSGRQLTVGQFAEKFTENCSAEFRQAYDGKKPSCGLTKAEWSEIQSFFGGLDCNSREECEKHLGYYEALLSRKLEEVSANGNKAKISAKIGLLLGFAVGLIFI